MSITVRQARPGDHGIADAHRHAGNLEQAGHRGRRDSRPAATQFLVAEIGPTPCGTLGWSEDGSRVRIEHVYVEEWARGVGVGDALVAALFALARERGAERVVSSALPGDRSLKNLFERNGLVAREIIVERELD